MTRIATAAAGRPGVASVSIGVRRGVASAVSNDGSRASSNDQPSAITCSRGWADLENDIAAAPHSVYRIGSLTKQFTAAAIMRLVERGELTVDDTLGHLIPEYPAQGHDITIRQLLTHTSGIKNYTEIAEFAEKSRLDLSHRQLGALFATKPLDFGPGERYHYSNSGYYLLGVIVEHVSGEPYYEFLQRELFTPLGLQATYYLDDYRIIKHRVHGYDLWQGQLVNAGQLSMTSPFAAGALGSTLTDLLAWETALTSGGVVSRDTFAAMATPGTLNDGSRTTYGYGIVVGQLRGHPKLSHGGTINGFRSQLAFYPADDLIVAVLCNNGGAAVEYIESEVARELLGLPELVVREVPLPTSALERHVGQWQSDSGPLTMALHEGRLVLGGGRLTAIAPDRFVMADDPDTTLTFSSDGGGDEMVIEREGQLTHARQVASA